jgi:hypothetical protein
MSRGGWESTFEILSWLLFGPGGNPNDGIGCSLPVDPSTPGSFHAHHRSLSPEVSQLQPFGLCLVTTCGHVHPDLS